MRSVRVLRTTLLIGAVLLPGCFGQNCVDPSATEAKDRITFRNGDVLTGRLLEVGTESLQFCNSALGQVSIPRQAVAEVKSIERVTGPTGGSFSLEQTVTLANATPAAEEEQVWEDPRGVSLRAKTSFKSPDNSNPQQAPSSREKTTDKKSPDPAVRWFFNVNAPPSVAFGTSSQQTYGGILDFQAYEGKLYRSEVWTSGTYNRAWQVKSPSIYTDNFDGYFQQSRKLASNRGGVYGRAEWFLNTSLGMALQESFGPGYFSPDKKMGRVEFRWLADLRYSRERLYQTRGGQDFVGSRFETQITYRRKDAHDPTKTKYLVIARSWINPMWNDEHALQAFTTWQVKFPFGKSVCLGFTPIEEDYMRNAPIGMKKNYVTSSVSLQIQRTYDPNKGCY